jgi:hypothetical protein
MLDTLLEKLPNYIYFNVISFGSSHLFSTLLKNTQTIPSKSHRKNQEIFC